MDLEAPTAAPRGFLGVGISSCLALSQATGLQSLVPLAALSQVRNGDGPDLGLPGEDRHRKLQSWFWWSMLGFPCIWVEKQCGVDCRGRWVYCRQMDVVGGVWQGRPVDGWIES